MKPIKLSLLLGGFTLKYWPCSGIAFCNFSASLASFCIWKARPRWHCHGFLGEFHEATFFCVLEHVETIICYKFICIDIKLGSNPQLREDLHFAIDSLLSCQAKLWGLFTRPTFSTTSSFVILCTEAWIQGCVCKASALGGSMWFLRDNPWDGQNVGLPWQGPFEMVGASAPYISVHF